MYTEFPELRSAHSRETRSFLASNYPTEYAALIDAECTFTEGALIQNWEAGSDRRLSQTAQILKDTLRENATTTPKP